jgi:enterochelin esterase-like enzyme
MSRRFCTFSVSGLVGLVMILAAAAGARKPDELGPPQVSAGAIIPGPVTASRHLGQLPRVWVWLPPAYAADDTARFPVLYMHDAENLFDRRHSNFDKEWQVDETITRMAMRSDLREWIVVGIESPKARYATLFPQKVLRFLPPDFQHEVLEGDFGGTARPRELKGDAYLAFIVRELKPEIDAQLRTLTGARDTAIMGASMGGLISLYAIAEYPDVFGQAAGLSTHLPLGGVDAPDMSARPAAVAAAFDAYLATTRLDPSRHRIYLDHGTATLDAAYPPFFKAFDTMMVSRGWALPNYESRAFDGAEHEENAWAQRLDIPLAFLDQDDP